MKSVQKVEGKGKCQQKEEKRERERDKGGKVGRWGRRETLVATSIFT